MTIRRQVAIAALSLLAAVPANAVTVIGNAHDALTRMKALNLIVLQDFRLGSDVEGKVYVGGNLTGSGTIGLGNAANGQYASGTGFHSTLAVGGSNKAQVNLNNGAGVGDNFGAYIVGDSLGFTLNATGGTVRVGGNLTGNMNLPNGTSLYVRGNANGVSAGTGQTIRVGGKLDGNVNVGSNSTLTAGSVGGNKLTVAAGNHFVVGGNVGQAEIHGGGATLGVTGSIGDINYSSGSTVKAGGSIGGNGNGMQAGVTVYAGGTVAGNANGATVSAGYQFLGDPGAAANAVAGPATPVAPEVASLDASTAQIEADARALSGVLAGLSTGGITSTVTFTSQGPVFHAVSNGLSTPYAVFTVDETIFNYSEVNYDFTDLSLPVIINVVNSNAAVHAAQSATYNWNLNPVGGASNLHNQQVIWNFTDASLININRQVQGSILAPTATVRNTGDINGSVIVKILEQSGEIHLGTYAGNDIFTDIDTAVPEPATWLQMITGFGLAGAVMRRRRRLVTGN